MPTASPVAPLRFRMKSIRAALRQFLDVFAASLAVWSAMVAALANSIFRGWQDLDTRMDCDHLKTHMPRYFFNLTNDIRTVVDADGVELEDEEAVRLEAQEMVADLREESHITGTDWSGWRMIVRDENGCDCFEVKF